MKNYLSILTFFALSGAVCAQEYNSPSEQLLCNGGKDPRDVHGSRAFLYVTSKDGPAEIIHYYTSARASGIGKRMAVVVSMCETPCKIPIHISNLGSGDVAGLQIEPPFVKLDGSALGSEVKKDWLGSNIGLKAADSYIILQKSTSFEQNINNIMFDKFDCNDKNIKKYVDQIQNIIDPPPPPVTVRIGKINEKYLRDFAGLRENDRISIIVNLKIDELGFARRCVANSDNKKANSYVCGQIVNKFRFNPATNFDHQAIKSDYQMNFEF